jgi:ankyrin repeat protein
MAEYMSYEDICMEILYSDRINDFMIESHNNLSVRDKIKAKTYAYLYKKSYIEKFSSHMTLYSYSNLWKTLVNFDDLLLLHRIKQENKFTEEDCYNILDYALNRNNYEITKFLLENNININHDSKYGLTYWWIYITGCNIENNMLKLLIEYGADVYSKHEDMTAKRYLIETYPFMDNIIIDVEEYYEQINSLDIKNPECDLFNHILVF